MLRVGRKVFDHIMGWREKHAPARPRLLDGQTVAARPPGSRGVVVARARGPGLPLDVGERTQWRLPAILAVVTGLMCGLR